jgi:phosphocarrier protein
MVEKPKRISRETIISNELGLHARSAAQIANLAGKANYKVWLAKSGEQVDATSIMDILMLECPKGTRVEVIIEDRSDLKILNKISRLIKDGFGE